MKRAINRAPSVHDPWWEEHRKTCGGTYIKTKEPEGYKQARKGKGSRTNTAGESRDKGSGKNITGESRDKGSRNIKDMMNSSSSSNPTKKSTSVSVVKPFEGKGHSLSIDVDAKAGMSLREKMLAAAEKRVKDQKERGIIRRGITGGKRKAVTSSPLDNHDIRSYTGNPERGASQASSSYTTVKRPKLSKELSSESDCILLDTDLPVHNGTRSSNGRASSSRSASPVIDLSKDCDSDSSLFGADIILGDPGMSGESSGFRMCPVCGRNDIPAAIIGAHIAFCIEEDNESRMVDNELLQ